MQIKNLGKRIICFNLSNILENYKTANEQEKQFLRMDIENIKINKPSRRKNEIINSFLVLTFILFAFISIPMLLDNSIRYENKYLFSIMFLSFAGLIAMRFKTLQCKYILKQFDKIDMEDKLNSASLKQRIAACNLYLK